jgi:hypothetical protein
VAPLLVVKDLDVIKDLRLCIGGAIEALTELAFEG